ncbi:type-1 restriction enzyme EcoKI specificity protein [Clostridium ragsdalei P11]|uniref:Type-1 restriction enzyme EcoKI specificity protein n=1 Tax=Clostridium ragsdalei P11 TaxID=1353534 RepID=A0A1A6AIX0_9CLOT|nr:restriction endonuclease subunit S [Clostridium ragsdalei]OBR90011.1 type-1 restriction enzyme EcoKI specificity protein [Clostridium ragsdalei P11]
MARAKKKKLSLEELLEEAIVKKEDRPYEVPENWVWTKLGNIIKVSSGKSLTSKKMISEGTIPVYGGNGVTGYHNDFNVEAPIIVIGRVGFYCGSVHFIKENAWVTDNALIVFFSKDKIDINFLYWLLSTINLRKNDSSTAQPVISGSKIYKLEFPLPPLPEQQRIVEVIESLFVKLDAAKELVQNALDSFENRKAAILHKAFTGELTAKWREEKGVSLDAWENKKLGEIAKFIGGGTPSKSVYDYWNGEIKWASVKDIKGDYIYSTLDYITEEGLNNSSSNLCEIDDLILVTRISPGKTVIAKDRIAINQDLKIIKTYINALFLHYYFVFYEQEIVSKSSGSTVLGVRLETLKEIKICIPSIEEQQEIVRILEDLLGNEQRAKELCDVIEKIDLMKKAILARAFRGELGTNNPEEESAVELLKEVLKEKL